MPFFDLLDQEEMALSAQVAETPEPMAVAAAMEATRRRLAQGVDAVVRSLPTAVRSDHGASRAVAYALVGLADGRMLYHPAGGLEQWRDRMLESDLYGSALAGQEVVERARAASHGVSDGSSLMAGDGSMLAPFYLAVFRAGFEGSLHDDAVGRAALVAALEEAVGVRREVPLEVAPDNRPSRLGLSPPLLAALGVGTWLVAGFAVWFSLAAPALADSERMAERISKGLPAESVVEPLERSVGPSPLTAARAQEGTARNEGSDTR